MTERGHLRLVPPVPPSGISAEAELFAFAAVGGEILICHDGHWDLAQNHHTAAKALERWTGSIAAKILAGEPTLRWPVRRP